MVLVQADFEGVVFNKAVYIGRKVVQDLEREVSKWLLGALNPLARVGFGERYSQVLSHGFHLAVVFGLGDVDFGCLCESVQVFDALAKIGVVDAGFEAELVL